MDQDHLQLVGRAIASFTDLCVCHAIIRTLTAADWLKCVRLRVDKLYQSSMAAIGCKTWYAPASCYLCVSFHVTSWWCVARYGLTQHSLGWALTVVGALDLIRHISSRQAPPDLTDHDQQI